MRDHQSELAAAGIELLSVTFDSVELARNYRAKRKIGWPMLIDTSAELYQKFGMGRATLWKLGNPAMIWRYLVTIFSGHLPGRKGRDIRQMGGSVLIDPNGIVKLNHVSEDSFDRPEVATILELVK